jgi:hypothetical protein
LSTNDLGENISDMPGGREHFSFWHVMSWHGMACHVMAWHGMAWHGTSWYGMVWHDINNLESMGISGECSHQSRTLNHVLLPIGDLISVWQPDHFMI